MDHSSSDRPFDTVQNLIGSANRRIQAMRDVGFPLFEGREYEGYWKQNMDYFAALFDDVETLKEVVLGRARIGNRDLELIFWIMTHAVHDVLWEASIPGYYEPYHNVALPSHLSAKHWFYSLASSMASGTSKPSIKYMWADCTKGNIECRVGADFVFVAPSNDRWRIMFVQAKRVPAGSSIANLSRSVGSDPVRQQIDILKATNEAFQQTTGMKRSDFAYYLFWHDRLENGKILPPSITPLSAVLRDVSDLKLDVLECNKTLDFVLYTSLDFATPGGGGPTVSESVLLKLFNELPDEQRPAKVLAFSSDGLDFARIRSLFENLDYRGDASSGPEDEGAPPALSAEPTLQETVWNPVPPRRKAEYSY